MKIVVIGGGGREHALVWALRQSPGVGQIFCIPGNAGIACEPRTVCLDIPLADHQQLIELARRHQAITVVGSEAPLAAGIVNDFLAAGLPIIGPSREAALIETNKAWCAEFLKRIGVPAPAFKVFDDFSAAERYVGTADYPLVIKASGLAAGKSVRVAHSEDEACRTLHEFMTQRVHGEAGQCVVIQEYLEGPEISVFAFVQDDFLLPTLTAQDHKPLLDGNKGPNTGGMGAYAPVPFVGPALYQGIIAKIMRPTVLALSRWGMPYSGVLYAGLMLTKEGPKVLEFNARLGDPEFQVLAMLLQTPLAEIFQAMAENQLHRIKCLEGHLGSACCVVLAAAGYPGKPRTGDIIKGLRPGGQAIDSPEGVHVFHAGTRKQDHSFVTNGGRVLGVTSCALDLPTAISNAYAAVEKINWLGMQFRRDIGATALH